MTVTEPAASSTLSSMVGMPGRLGLAESIEKVFDPVAPEAITPPDCVTV